MARPIAVQLYSVRKELEHDFEGVIRQIADMGYGAVEPTANIIEQASVETSSALFKELGLTVCSIHGGLPVCDDRNKVLDMLAALDCKKIVSGKGPKGFDTLDHIKESCESFNASAAVAVEAGLQFGIHNHDFEYQPVGDRLAIDYMLDHLSADVNFQIDTYWVKTAGQDPVEVINRIGERVFLLHIKDGPCKRGEPMKAAGTGVMDFPPIVEAAVHAEYMIVELDSCATDMIEAVRESYDYLINSDLAEGRN